MNTTPLRRVLLQQRNEVESETTASAPVTVAELIQQNQELIAQLMRQPAGKFSAPVESPLSGRPIEHDTATGEGLAREWNEISALRGELRALRAEMFSVHSDFVKRRPAARSTVVEVAPAAGDEAAAEEARPSAPRPKRRRSSPRGWVVAGAVAVTLVAAGAYLFTVTRSVDAHTVGSSVAAASPERKIRTPSTRVEGGLGQGGVSLPGLGAAPVADPRPDRESAQAAKSGLELGLAYARVGRGKEALTEFRAAVAADPDNQAAREALAILLGYLGQEQEAIAAYRDLLELAPDSIVGLNNLACLLLSATEALLRDPVEALRLAERACALQAEPAPLTLETLAAAHAAAGRFERALSICRDALARAEQQRDHDTVKLLRERIARYERGDATIIWQRADEG